MRKNIAAMAFLMALFAIFYGGSLYGIQFQLWGSQKEGTTFSGPKIGGNTVTLTSDAKIVNVARNADSFTVFRNGSEYVTIEKGHVLTGVLPPGEYTLRTSSGRVTILLDTEFTAEKIILWGRQKAIVKPLWEGNYIALGAPTPIVGASYDGTDGMGIFRNRQHRAFLQFISPHNMQNPGPKVIDITGAVVAKSLVGQVLPVGVYSLTPGRGTGDGIVYGEVVLNVGAVAPGAGWQAVVSGGNKVDINGSDICIRAMEKGKGFAALRRPYDFTGDYTVAFDFKLQDKDNHWFILFSDTFVHVHIDWGTALHYLGPRNTRIMNMDVGRWYHVKIAAHPAKKSFEIYVDGKRAGMGVNVTPGSMDAAAGLGTSGPDGPAGAWLYVGDDQGTAYDRGVACWKNISFSYTPVTPAEPPAVYHIFSNVPKQNSAAFKSNRYQGVQIATRTWDKIPYHLTAPYTGTISVAENQTVILAGDADGSKPWYVDNFLLFELSSPAGGKRFVIGSVEPVTFHGAEVPHIGPNTFTFSPGSLNLKDLFPKGVPVDLRISALDYGGVGGLSAVYLIVE